MSPSDPDPGPSLSVLFVCLGNICRSPLAEGVFVQLLEEEGLEGRVDVDSAGTGAYHVGESPDPRSVEVAGRNGVTLRGHARQTVATDLERFDYVIAMDGSNLRNLRRLVPGGGAAARLHLLREFDPDAVDEADRDVPDPYYGGADGFDRVYEMVERSCRALLDEIRSEHGI